MDATETRRELQRRMLEWGREEYRRELAEGLPLLRSVPGPVACRVVAAFERSTPAERQRLAEALLKDMYCREPGQEPASTRDEMVLVERFWEETALDYATWRPRRGKIGRTLLGRAVRDALAPVLGEPDKEGTHWPVHLVYVTDLGGWEIDTVVELRDAGIRYEHVLRAQNRANIASSTSLFLLGIGQPMWDDLIEAEVPAVVKSLVSLCRDFLSRAPQLVAGLAPPERGEFGRPRGQLE